MSEDKEMPAHGNSNLGWLTQSTSQPKKRKEIEGKDANI
jgi:hypothetical protein